MMNKKNKKDFTAFKNKYVLESRQEEQLKIYIDLLEYWQKRTKLVSSADVHNIVSKHISESFQFLNVNYINTLDSVMDLGSGGGFPGIPLAVMCPNTKFVLLDSRRIKTLFIQDVVEMAKLSNVKVVCQRVEKVIAEMELFFNVVTARAVSTLESLWHWSEPLLVEGGVLLAQKGGDIDKEVKTISNECTVEVYSVFDDITKKLIVLKKE